MKVRGVIGGCKLEKELKCDRFVGKFVNKCAKSSKMCIKIESVGKWGVYSGGERIIGMLNVLPIRGALIFQARKSIKSGGHNSRRGPYQIRWHTGVNRADKETFNAKVIHKIHNINVLCFLQKKTRY